MVLQIPFAQRPVEFIASAKRDLAAMPKSVKAVFGFAIFQAEIGEKHLDAKPLKGFGGAGVLEVVDDFDGDTYRAIYTVKFSGVVYVLDAFQKKAKKGSKTPKQDMDRIKSRLKLAEQHYDENYRRKISIA
jgi:phage-related protein